MSCCVYYFLYCLKSLGYYLNRCLYIYLCFYLELGLECQLGFYIIFIDILDQFLMPVVFSYGCSFYSFVTYLLDLTYLLCLPFQLSFPSSFFVTSSFENSKDESYLIFYPFIIMCMLVLVPPDLYFSAPYFYMRLRDEVCEFFSNCLLLVTCRLATIWILLFLSLLFLESMLVLGLLMLYLFLLLLNVTYLVQKIGVINVFSYYFLSIQINILFTAYLLQIIHIQLAYWLIMFSIIKLIMQHLPIWISCKINDIHEYTNILLIVTQYLMEWSIFQLSCRESIGSHWQAFINDRILNRCCLKSICCMSYTINIIINNQQQYADIPIATTQHNIKYKTNMKITNINKPADSISVQRPQLTTGQMHISLQGIKDRQQLLMESPQSYDQQNQQAHRQVHKQQTQPYVDGQLKRQSVHKVNGLYIKQDQSIQEPNSADVQQQDNKNKILIDHNKNEIYGCSNSYQFKDVFNKANSKNDFVFNIKLSHNGNNIVNIKNSANVNTSANINYDNRKQSQKLKQIPVQKYHPIYAYVPQIKRSQNMLTTLTNKNKNRIIQKQKQNPNRVLENQCYQFPVLQGKQKQRYFQNYVPHLPINISLNMKKNRYNTGTTATNVKNKKKMSNKSHNGNNQQNEDIQRSGIFIDNRSIQRYGRQKSNSVCQKNGKDLNRDHQRSLDFTNQQIQQDHEYEQSQRYSVDLGKHKHTKGQSKNKNNCNSKNKNQKHKYKDINDLYVNDSILEQHHLETPLKTTKNNHKTINSKGAMGIQLAKTPNIKYRYQHKRFHTDKNESNDKDKSGYMSIHGQKHRFIDEDQEEICKQKYRYNSKEEYLRVSRSLQKDKSTYPNPGARDNNDTNHNETTNNHSNKKRRKSMKKNNLNININLNSSLKNLDMTSTEINGADIPNPRSLALKTQPFADKLLIISKLSELTSTNPKNNSNNVNNLNSINNTMMNKNLNGYFIPNNNRAHHFRTQSHDQNYSKALKNISADMNINGSTYKLGQMQTNKNVNMNRINLLKNKAKLLKEVSTKSPKGTIICFQQLEENQMERRELIEHQFIDVDEQNNTQEQKYNGQADTYNDMKIYAQVQQYASQNKTKIRDIFANKREKKEWIASQQIQQPNLQEQRVEQMQPANQWEMQQQDEQQFKQQTKQRESQQISI